MAKRFADTRLSEEKWYRRLSLAHKCTWRFLTDRCDHAGVWPVDEDQIEFYVGEAVPLQGFIEAVNSDGKQRLRLIGKDKLLITGFVPFQYGTLSVECNAHKPVFARLRELGLTQDTLREGYLYPSEDVRDPIGRVQEKEKEKEKEIRGVQGGDSEETGAPLPELAGVPGSELLRQIKPDAQESWCGAFGVELIRRELPKAAAKWKSDPDRNEFGRLPLYLYHWFGNALEAEKKAQARASPEKPSAVKSNRALRNTGKPCAQALLADGTLVAGCCAVHTSGEICSMEGRGG